MKKQTADLSSKALSNCWSCGCSAVSLSNLLRRWGADPNIIGQKVVTFIMIAGLLSLAAFLACYLPARRAAKIDPLVALRYE